MPWRITFQNNCFLNMGPVVDLPVYTSVINRIYKHGEHDVTIVSLPDDKQRRARGDAEHQVNAVHSGGSRGICPF